MRETAISMARNRDAIRFVFFICLFFFFEQILSNSPEAGEYTLFRFLAAVDVSIAQSGRPVHIVLCNFKKLYQ